MLSGAYELLKAVKEYETYLAGWMPSQSKTITEYLPYKESITLLFEAVYELQVTANNNGGGFLGDVIYNY